jgi:mono/diheme cytochrome c family protein
MIKMIQKSIITLTVLFLPYAAIAAGSELHATSCTECHSKMTGGDGSVLYQRSDRIVTSKNALSERVEHCAKGANTNWDQDQIKLVTEYLNASYYKF